MFVGLAIVFGLFAVCFILKQQEQEKVEACIPIRIEEDQHLSSENRRHPLK